MRARVLLLFFTLLVAVAGCDHASKRMASSALAERTLSLAGGGLSNWLDRVLHQGFVTDFILLRAGALHTGVFNVADVAVVAGALLIAASRRRAPAIRGA